MQSGNGLYELHIVSVAWLLSQPAVDMNRQSDLAKRITEGGFFSACTNFLKFIDFF
jgi:hypothetical protein